MVVGTCVSGKLSNWMTIHVNTMGTEVVQLLFVLRQLDDLNFPVGWVSSNKDLF